MKMKEITAKLMALALCGCMTCSDQKLHYINKATKEEKTIDTPYAKDTSSKTPTVTLNGDFIIYSSNDNTELHAFNTKTGDDNIVYSAKGKQFVKLTSEKKAEQLVYNR